MGYFFFTHSRLFTALYPTLCVKQKNYKKILQITIYEKSKYFTVIVSQMRVLGQKKLQGGRQTPPPPSLYRVNIFFSFSNLGCSLHGEMSKIVECCRTSTIIYGNRANKELIPLQYKHISNSKIIHNLCTNYILFIKARIQRFLNQSRVVYLFWESYSPPLPLLELYFFSKVHDLKQVYFTGPAETSGGGGVQRRPLLSFFLDFSHKWCVFCALKRSTTNYKVPPKISYFFSDMKQLQ